MTRRLGIKALCISFIILCGTICFNIATVNAQDCTFTLSRTSITIPAIGAGGTSQPRGKVDPGYPVPITASKGSCPWAATSSVSWITLSPASGTGSGRTNLTVAPNTSGSQRTGTIQVAGQTLTVTQAYDCTFTLSRTSITVPARGSATPTSPTKADPPPFTITASKGSCPWAATTSANWITLVTTSGTGTGKVQFAVAPNTSGAQRTGTIQVGGQTLTVTQGATTQSTCSIAISPANKTFDPKGGKGTIAVTTDAGCSWTASTKEDWIHITSGASSKGKGTVQYTVDQNQGAQRTGTIIVADKTVTVSQKGSKSQKSDTKKPIRK